MSARIELRKLVKAYGNLPVIQGVDLTIEPGEFTVFVGPSGCGKSTLLRMIAGLEPITSGDLLIDGRRLNDVPPAKRGMAMVFQSYALYPHMTVRKNLSFGLETVGTPRAEIAKRVTRAAEILRIEQLLDRRPKALSGGQRQRVAIGRAIVRNPQIFLFDEPLSNLDAELRVQMRVEIANLHNDLGNTMIYVTHDQVEAMTMADKIVVLRAGLIEQVGAPLELYNNPSNLFVAGFIGSPKMNFLKATDRQLGFDPSGNNLLLDRDRSGGVTLGVRPEHIFLSETEGARFAEVKVNLLENLGGQTLVHATTFDGQALTIALDGQQKVNIGTTLPVFAKPSQLYLFDQSGNRCGVR